MPGNRSKRSWRILVLLIVGCVGCFATSTLSRAQTGSEQTLERGGATYSSLLPPDLNEVADSERQTWTPDKLLHQQYAREVYWDFPAETPAFFRDTLVQVVARTYDLTRDNSDGSKTQGWAAGGWLAYRSGLIGDVFGIQAAFYTSQPLIAPGDEPGSKLLTPNQGALNVFGQAYARAQIYD